MTQTTTQIIKLSETITKKARPLYVDGTLIGYKVPVREIDRLSKLVEISKQEED